MIYYNDISDKEQTQRILYLDIMRIMAVFAIILLHVSLTQWSSFPIASYEWKIFNFYNGISRWCIPVFVMLSGVFLLDYSRYNKSVIDNFEQILAKNISRILFALVFWSIFYLYFNMYILNHFDKNPIRIFDFLFGSTYYHLWFLYLLIGLYFLAPFLQPLMRILDKKEVELLLIVLAFFGCGLAFLNVFSKFFLNQLFYFPVSEFSGYLVYFLAGFYFANFEISKATKYKFYILAILSLLITIFLNYFFAELNGKARVFFFDYKYLNTMFVSFGVFIFIKNVFGNLNPNSTFAKFITSISKLTFGIYLIHVAIIVIITRKFLITTTLNPIIMVPLLSLAVFVISALLAFIISKIPILRKVV